MQCASILLFQLAAVEEEKRQLDVQLQAVQEGHERTLEELRQKAEQELRHWNMEKMELETQLQSLQKCFVSISVMFARILNNNIVKETVLLLVKCQQNITI